MEHIKDFCGRLEAYYKLSGLDIHLQAGNVFSPANILHRWEEGGVAKAFYLESLGTKPNECDGVIEHDIAVKTIEFTNDGFIEAPPKFV